MCNYSSFVWRNTWQHLINRCCHILACLKCCCKIYRPNIWNNDRLFRECNGSLGEYFSFTEVVITSVCWRKNSVPRKRKLCIRVTKVIVIMLQQWLLVITTSNKRNLLCSHRFVHHFMSSHTWQAKHTLNEQRL